jgi:beta-lactamase class A
MQLRLTVTALLAWIAGYSFGQTQTLSMEQLTQQVKEELGKQKGVFAVAFKNTATGETLLLNEKENFHAASTMKTPVMMEVYKQAAAGRFSLTDTVHLRNEFHSIADGSPYSLSPADDSDSSLYTQPVCTIADLVYKMIIVSSNLATNTLIEKVDARNIMQTMRSLGATDIQVLRGVEDNKAFQKGLNNMVTAYDLMLLYDKMARGETVSPEASAAMIRILSDQQFNEIIPARLPAGVKVAHKTGFIKGIHHDSGIVFLPDGRSYVLVLLSKNWEDEQQAIAAMAQVSYLVYRYITHT